MENNWKKHLKETVKDYQDGKFGVKDWQKSIKGKSSIEKLAETVESYATRSRELEANGLTKNISNAILDDKYKYKTSFITEKGFDRIVEAAIEKTFEEGKIPDKDEYQSSINWLLRDKAKMAKIIGDKKNLSEQETEELAFKQVLKDDMNRVYNETKRSFAQENTR